jgi:hypothetical protein
MADEQVINDPISLYNKLKSPVDTSKTIGEDLKAFMLKSLQLGPMGFRARLGPMGSAMKLPDSTFQSLRRLEQQKPVDQAWVENWAKEAGVPIRKVTGQDTKYVHFDTPFYKPGSKPPQVRLPLDEGAHMGTSTHGLKEGGSQVGNVFDTGIGAIKPSTGHKISPNIWGRREPTLINESGMSYANPEALDAALKWRLHPPNKNWLISEDMAPRLPASKPLPEVPGTITNPQMFKLPYNIPTITEMLAAVKKNGP